jgi:thiamine pyrophosphokinase
LSELRILVVADGDADPNAMHRYHAANGDSRATVIAADGGAHAAEAAGLLPDLIVGDADSLSDADIERYVALGVDVDRHPPEKEQSDTELALEAALARGAAEIRLTGALGGQRIEHAIANLLLLADPRLDGRDVAIERHQSTIRRIGTQDGPGALGIRGTTGDYVSLLPLEAEVTGISTDGLRYPLKDETLSLGPTRGLSNELLGQEATVRSGRGRLLVVHTPRSAGQSAGGPS